MSLQYLSKALQLFVIFSKFQDPWLISVICDDLILLSLLQFLIKLEDNSEQLQLITAIFKNLVQEPSVLDNLEKAGLI